MLQLAKDKNYPNKSTGKNSRELSKIQLRREEIFTSLQSPATILKGNPPNNNNRKKSSYLISSLDHSLLPLQLNVLLFLSIGESPRHTEEESAGAKDPQSLSTEHDAGLRERGECGNSAGDLTAGAGGNHVFEGGDTLVEGFAFNLDI